MNYSRYRALSAIIFLREIDEASQFSKVTRTCAPSTQYKRPLNIQSLPLSSSPVLAAHDWGKNASQSTPRSRRGYGKSVANDSGQYPCIDRIRRNRICWVSMLNKHASRGQVLILFAGAAVALIGMLGLAIDLGFSMAQRRTMQNAADAGAMAGAHAIARSNPASPISVLTDVTTVAKANSIGGNQPTIKSCFYVDNTDKNLGDCSLVVPATASGVHVSVSESHSTFFIRAIPGGPRKVSTGASATAHVEVLKSLPSDGPFLVCGAGTKLESGSSMDIVTKQADGTWKVNSAAAGKIFQIYGPQSSTCGAHDNSYKGLAAGTNNTNITPPAWFNYNTGTSVGNINTNVNGIQGCQAGREAVNCVAYLPVVVNDPPEVGNSRLLWGVMILPFYITKPSNNVRDGKLIPGYVSTGEANLTWDTSHTESVVIRLTK